MAIFSLKSRTCYLYHRVTNGVLSYCDHCFGEIGNKRCCLGPRYPSWAKSGSLWPKAQSICHCISTKPLSFAGGKVETICSICALDSLQVGPMFNCCHEHLVPRGLDDKDWKTSSVHKLITRAGSQHQKVVAYSGASATAVTIIVTKAEARASSLAGH